MRVVNLNQMVTAQYFDEEFEEWSMQSKTIEDLLWNTIDENVDDISFDAVPVRYGKWIAAGFMAAKCSICGAIQYELADTNFCPNCGAKMEERIALNEDNEGERNEID